MKKKYFTITTLFITLLSFGQSVFINEIHYDNTSTDVNEGFEIFGPAGTDLSIYTIELYTGADGTKYKTVNLSGTIPDQGNNLGTVWFTGFGSMQNGKTSTGTSEADGIALSNSGTLIQFLSYEGIVTATNGVASGTTSTNIGVEEQSPVPAVGNSLQLIGTGNDYSDFTWSGPLTATPNASNTGQVLPVIKQGIIGFSMYPNPVTNGEFSINSSNNSEKNVQIYDMLGKQVYSKVVTASERVQVSNLNTGIYILKVLEEGKTATRKLVIE